MDSSPFPKDLEITARARLLDLILEKSYREGSFKLASGKESSFYINLKPTTLDPEGATLIGALGFQKISEVFPEVEAVGGMTLGADPIATAISMSSFFHQNPWSAFIVRKEAKGHGTQEFVEGIENLSSSAKAVVLEDVVTTGKTGIQAVQRLREAGFEVVGVFAVVDREEGGREAFESEGVNLHSLFRLSDLQKAKQA